MNAQCHHCKTVFRVDPRKVPAGGVRARCSICRNVFQVPGGQGGAAEAAVQPPPAGAGAPASGSAPVGGGTPPVTPAGGTAPVPTGAPTRTAATTPATPATPQPPTPASATTASAGGGAATAGRAPAAAGAPAAGGARPNPFAFGVNDPGAKARRLARALVSDIVMYHPDRRDRALADGTLKREFMDEIKKSWEEYVAQVGQEAAKSSPHFRDALNDILAKGQQVF